MPGVRVKIDHRSPMRPGSRPRSPRDLSFESGFNRPGENAYQIRRLDVFGSDTPAMLLRKIRLGTNDGSLTQLIYYYLRRILRLN